VAFQNCTGMSTPRSLYRLTSRYTYPSYKKHNMVDLNYRDGVLWKRVYTEGRDEYSSQMKSSYAILL
jgi:hypothetical protein